MVWWQILLFPLAVLYELITRARNFLYDKAVIKPIHFDTNVIVVGNLSVGGTGKSPFVQYLVEYFLSRNITPGILSRGYKRSTYDFRMVDEDEDAKTVGDEPFMFYNRYPHVGIFVGNEKELAVPQLLFCRDDIQVILMDDAFQNRIVQPDFNILLTTYQRPFYQDWVLPSGRLREGRDGAGRANCVIVSKCPQNLIEADQSQIRSRIHGYTSAPVFFTTIEYANLRPLFQRAPPLKTRVVGISGIAGPQLFEEYLKANFDCKIIHHYRDHHRYSRLDVKHICNELDDHTSLITTEKDMVKLREFGDLKNFSCYYLPISMKFLKDEALFHTLVESGLKKEDV